MSNEGGQLRVQRTIGDLINIIKIQPLIGKPGEKESYSNNGYRILAFVIEKVSGKSLKDFLRENFFTPLGMRDTGEDEQIDLVAERANGYVRWIGGSLANVPFYDMSNNIGAAGLYSSAEDLFRWDVSLYEAKILKRSSVDLMIKEDYGIGERKTRE